VQNFVALVLLLVELPAREKRASTLGRRLAAWFRRLFPANSGGSSDRHRAILPS
jgi:hypothetical protein